MGRPELHNSHTRGRWNMLVRRQALLLMITGLLLLSACSPVLATEQPAEVDWVTLAEGSSAGQTFVSRFDGLNGFAVHLRPVQTGEGEIRLTIRTSGESQVDLASSSLPASDLERSGYYRFSFPTIPASTNESYYAFLEVSGPAKVELAAGPEHAYLNGALYQDHQPARAQAAFRLVYHPVALAVGLLRMGLGWVGWLVLALFLFGVPGWAIFVYVDPKWKTRSWTERIALANGLGLGIYPIFVLWAGAAGLQWGALFAWIPPVLGLLALAWRYSRRPGRGVQEPPAAESSGRPQRRDLLRIPSGLLRENPNLWPDLALLCVLALVVGTRFWTIRNLAGPMWGDSVQHAVMAQLFVDHGGLYDSWQPYAPYASLTVQYGFALYSALLAWLTGMPAIQATLVMGQVLNVYAVFLLAPLALRISGGRRWAAAGAVLAAGLLSPTPADYVNWGRYPQLAGLAVLPAALWALWEVGQGWRPEKQKILGLQVEKGAGMILVAGILLSGTLLNYYRMAFYYAAFALVWLFALALPHWKSDPKEWWKGALRLAGTAIAALLALLPWIPRMMGSRLAEFADTGAVGGSQLQAITSDYRTWLLAGDYVPLYLLALAAAAAIWALARRDWMAAGLPLWIALVAAYPLGQLAGLPASNMLTTFSLLISLYLPVGLLLGWLTSQIASVAANETARPVSARASTGYTIAHSIAPVLALGLLALAGWGAKELRSTAQPAQFAILTFPDLRAMEWIRTHIPEDAQFLIEGFRDRPSAAVGADAGWYLPLLSGRANNIPPQYALLSEIPEEPGYSKQVVQLVAELEDHPIPADEALAALCTYGITHAYIGQGNGQVGYGVEQLYSFASLESSGWFNLVYHQDRVSIFALKPELCPAPR